MTAYELSNDDPKRNRYILSDVHNPIRRCRDNIAVAIEQERTRTTCMSAIIHPQVGKHVLLAHVDYSPKIPLVYTSNVEPDDASQYWSQE